MKKKTLPNNCKPIPGLSTYYATPEGEIWRKYMSKQGFAKIPFEKIIQLKATCIPNGYCLVQPYINGKRCLKYVHRLVAKTFLGKIPKGKQVDHIDRDRTNNNVSNLQYLTPKANLNRRLVKSKTYAEGRKQHKQHKGKHDEIRPLILKLRKEGKKAREIALELAIPIQTVYIIKS